MAATISPCVVCGEAVRGSPYVSIEMFGVFDEQHRGIFFEPDHGMRDFETWQDIPHLRCIHLRCVQTYFEGVLADARLRIGSD